MLITQSILLFTLGYAYNMVTRLPLYVTVYQHYAAAHNTRHAIGYINTQVYYRAEDIGRLSLVTIRHAFRAAIVAAYLHCLIHCGH